KEDLPPELRQGPSTDESAEVQDDQQAIIRALREARGNRAKAARLLGISRATLYRRINEYDL
ncbi:MAG: helix-turn-helix domain-containing protein, partial [Candidatus Competibacterales bacterium]|nr:helix-turn-helix domain-containing protein [Candidatus Competibacterales bacterium]